MLDYNHLSRIGEYSNLVRDSDKAYKIMIDHHQDPDLDIKMSSYQTPLSSSTCQVIV